MNCPLKKRWTRRKEARPQELLEAALDLFVERGYAATRLDDVAARAGVSKGTLYLYFTSKEELFKAVIRENVLPILGEAETLFGQFTGSSADMLREFVRQWWERLGNTRLSGITKLMMAEANNFPEVAQYYHDEVIMRGQQIIGQILERGMQSGEFRRVDVEQTMNVVCAPVLMLMLWKHSFNACRKEALDPHTYLDSFLDLFLHGLQK
ncbi:MAG TPA: TetR/AcrR family transcriptional regulator [Noviherbaspirillum sp.]